MRFAVLLVAGFGLVTAANIREKRQIQGVTQDPILALRDLLSQLGNGATIAPGSIDTSALPANVREGLQALQNAGLGGSFDISGLTDGQDIVEFLDRFRSMSGDIQRALSNATELGGFSPDDLRNNIDPDVWAAFDFRQVKNFWDTNQTAAVCESMVTGGVASESFQSAAAELNCLDALRGKGVEIDQETAEAILAAKVQNKPVNNWSRSDWEAAIETSPSGIAGYMDMMPPATLRTSLGTVAREAAGLDKASRRKVFDRLRTAAGGFAQLSASDLMNAGELLEDAPIEMLNELPIGSVKGALANIDFNRMKGPARLNLAKKIRGENFNSWSNADKINVLPLLRDDPEAMDSIQLDFANNLTDIGNIPFDSISGQKIKEKLLRDNNYANLGNWNAATIRKAKHVLAAMRVSEIAQIADDQLEQAMDQLTAVKFDKDVAREILKKVKRIHNNVVPGTVLGLRKLGRLLSAMTSDDVNTIAPNNLKQIMPDLCAKWDDLEEPTKRTIVTRVRQATGGDAGLKSIMLPCLKAFSKEELESFITNAGISLNGNEDLRMLRLKPEHAKVLFAKMKTAMGAITYGNAAYTKEKMEKLRPLLCGIECDDIKNLPEGKTLRNVFKVLAKCELSDAIKKCAVNKIKTVLSWEQNKRNLASVIKDRDIHIFAKFATVMSKEDLEFLAPGAKCRVMLKAFARMEETATHPAGAFHDANLNQLKALWNFFKNCTSKLSGTISDEDVRDLGSVACGIDVNDIERLDAKVFQNTLGDLSEKCDLRQDVSQKIYEQIKTKRSLNPATMTADDLASLSGLMREATDAELDAIPKGEMRRCCVSVADKTRKRRLLSKAREEAGNANDLTEAEKTSRKEGIARIGQRMASALRDARSSGGRKKRAGTSSVTCNDIISMGTMMTSLTVAELDLADQEFLNCAATLGAEDGWSTEQKQQLAAIATRSSTWGAPNTWTTTNVQDAGIIVQGLSADQIGQLPLSTTNAINAIGQYPGYEVSQLIYGFLKHLGDAHANNPANIDGTELTSLGQFACGATSSQISNMLSTSYQTAASTIGKLTSCEQGQQQQYIIHAKNAYGSDVATWDSATILSVGTMIGGLNTADIQKLTETQINSITTTSIAAMPPSTFAAFSVTQIGYLSPAQARSVTYAQQSALTQEQLDALIAAGATVLSSGAVHVICSASSLLLVLAATLYLL